jgi:hypothetical protein
MPYTSEIEERIRRLCGRLPDLEYQMQAAANGIGALAQAVKLLQSFPNDPGCAMTFLAADGAPVGTTALITDHVTHFVYGFGPTPLTVTTITPGTKVDVVLTYTGFSPITFTVTTVCGDNDTFSEYYLTPCDPCQRSALEPPFMRVPGTLIMSVNNPLLMNQLFQDCTITLQAKPSWTSPLPLPDPIYLSGPLTCHDGGPNNGLTFYYSFECYQGYYVLFRLFPTCTFGTPYRELVCYQWVIGYQGSTCTPFVLPQGIGFAGMDPGSIVSVTG